MLFFSPADMPSVSSDTDNVISSTPDADGSSQEMFRPSPIDVSILCMAMCICVCVCLCVS